MLTEVPDEKQVSESYLDKRAANNAFWSNQALQHGGQMAATASTGFIRKATLSRLGEIVKTDDCVLEVGCGNATSLLAPLSLKCHAYGADLTFEMLLAAKKYHAKIQGLVRSDACYLPFKDASFDVVYSSRCLINVVDQDMQQRAMREIFRVAKPGGSVVLVENFQEPVARMNLAIERYHAGPRVVDPQNLLLNLDQTLDYSQKLGWGPIRIRGNTLVSFTSHILVGTITRRRGGRIVERLLYPLYSLLTWVEDSFGARFPLYGKDTLVLFQKRLSADLGRD